MLFSPERLYDKINSRISLPPSLWPRTHPHHFCCGNVVTVFKSNANPTTCCVTKTVPFKDNLKRTTKRCSLDLYQQPGEEKKRMEI